jgi:hypothetical protein
VHQLEKEPGWSWTIKPPTANEDVEMARFMNSGRVTAGPDGISREVVRTDIEVAIMEVVLTFGGTTIPADPGNPEGGPVLAPDASKADVEGVVRAMPTELLKELWGAVGEAVPGWGPAKNPQRTDP